MFTPPASPAPPRVRRDPSPSPEPSDEEVSSQYLFVPRSVSPSCSSSLTLPTSPSRPTLQSKANPAHAAHAASAEAKRRVARHTRWTILLVPAVLVLITLSTRYVSHPAVLDVFSSDKIPDSWETLSDLGDLRPHKRHASPDSATLESSLILQSSSSSAAPSTASSVSVAGSLASSDTSSGSSGSSAASSASASASGTPTAAIPTIPAQPPVLPTPFPQPLDQTLNQNYSTIGCETFIQNLTQSTAFRSCRPFSLLLQSSNAFIQAQENFTELNAIIWGTCNTDTPLDTCISNMAGFADTLKTQCADDLKDGNAIVQSTLTGLEAYTLMRNTACVADQGTNSYCFVEAAANPDPADLYLYSLPLGTQLPASATPSCTACTKSVMSLYQQGSGNLTALSEVYNGAATVVNQVCGNDFVQIAAVNGGAGATRSSCGWVTILGLVSSAVMLLW